MELPATRARCLLQVIDETPSTNDSLVARATGADEYTAVLTTSQTEGRGRLGRRWVAAPGDGVAFSVLLRPAGPAGGLLPVDRWGWIPLLAGLAMARAVRGVLPPVAEVGLKWPNDVQVDGQKVCGILAELLPGADGLVLGAGVNLETPVERLPTETSTSLRLHGTPLRGDGLVDAVCGGFLEQFQPLYARLLESSGDAAASGLAAEVAASCTTIGRDVIVTLPGAPTLTGEATGLDADGRLEVRQATGRPALVAAGDVTHLRYE